MVKTLCFYFRGHGFKSLVGNLRYLMPLGTDQKNINSWVTLQRPDLTSLGFSNFERPAGNHSLQWSCLAAYWQGRGTAALHPSPSPLLRTWGVPGESTQAETGSSHPRAGSGADAFILHVTDRPGPQSFSEKRQLTP